MPELKWWVFLMAFTGFLTSPSAAIPDISIHPAAPALDSTRVAVRAVPAASLTPYLNDAAFQYDRARTPLGLWDIFLSWLDHLVTDALERLGNHPAGRYVFYGAAILGALWLIRLFLGADFLALFYGNQPASPAARALTHPDDIRGVDYERRIQAAVTERQYRLAIRLFYLRTLKTLAERRLITWMRDKTNDDYLNELPESACRAEFAELTRVFAYVWYGRAPIDQTAFHRLQSRFERFDQQSAASP